ncbi:MAG: hypothetical protein GQ531_05025 [Sulfurovum sp.]|nr:hypothetical protein [Sulfurovum sp.]
MKINLEILESAYVYAPKEIEDLHTKELVPKMMTRRRLTRAAKMAIYLADKVSFSSGRVVYGSSFGELDVTAKILEAIHQNESISPTHFQNSVYNTAVSYLSMLDGNESEMMTISSGDKTALNVLKAGAIKALDGDTLLLLVTETLNIDKLEEVNDCIDVLECGVALKVRLTNKAANQKIHAAMKLKNVEGLPLSLLTMFDIAQRNEKSKSHIIELEL